MPPHHTKSKLQAVLEESTSTNVAKHPSVTTAVKSMASVLLGPRGKTPIENIMTMQHFQLWGFILVVVGLIYIVWLMQKKLDSIDKQYKEQFVLLHRLFKSHQDLQVEVRKKSGTITTHANTPTSAAPVSNVVVTPSTPTPTLTLEDEEEIDFENSMNNHTSDENQMEPHDPHEPEKQTSEDETDDAEDDDEDEDELVEETEDDEEQPEGEDDTEDLDYEEYDVADE